MGRRIAALLALAVAFAAPAHAQQGTISGRVLDASSLRPLSAAQVSAPGGYGGLTDARGGFSFSVPAGTYEVSVELIGYTDQS